MDYANTSEEEMLEDMKNLAEIVDKNGIFCITCDPKKYPQVNAHIEKTKEMLKSQGFYEESDGIFRKPSENLSEISATF